MNHLIKVFYFSFSMIKQLCVGENMINLISLKSSSFFLSFDVHIVISPALEFLKSIIIKKSTFFDFGRFCSNFPEFFVLRLISRWLSSIWQHFYSDWSNLRSAAVLASFENFENKNLIYHVTLQVTWPHIRVLWTIFDPLSDDIEI